MASSGHPDIIGDCVQCKSQLSHYLKIRECENLHKICGECLMCKLDESEDGKVTCPECGTSLRKLPKLQNEPVYVFVDQSNVWTEAKKKVSRDLQLKCPEDPRVRVHAGKLADVVSQWRPLARGKVYGSEPPPIDSVWEKMKESKFEVEVFKRSTVTGKEKQVDQQLVADITKTVCDHSLSKGTIAIVCGDADVLTAIRKTVEKGWKCEVWIWKQCCARAIKETEKENPTLMKVVFLDDYTNEITFMNFLFKRKNFTRDIELTSAVIVKANEVEELKPGTGWESELSKDLHWPFQHFFTGTNFDNLVLVFQNLASENDFEEIMRKLCKAKCFRKRAKTYVAYSNSLIKTTETGMSSASNRFHVLQALPEDPASAATTANSVGKGATASGEATDSPNKNDFRVVKNKRKTKSRTENPQKYSQPCEDGAHCKSGVECPFYHTQEELKFFRSGRNKAFVCKMKYSCSKGEKCYFAHHATDSFCCYCSKWGHLEGEAKMEKCFKKKPSGGAGV